MPTPRESIRRTIERWEGLFQAYTWDPGNYVTMPNGTQRLVGTQRGVTPAVLAAHRGMKPWEMTESIMRSVTLDEAAEIGEVRYYKGTGLDLLPWGPATDVLVDIGWGSGPRQAILFAQRLAGVKDDGVIGPITVAAFQRWLEEVGWKGAVLAVHEKRMAFYRALGRQDPVKYGPPQPGWKNRADWMLPGGDWWSHWENALPPIAPAPAIMPRPLPSEEAAPVALPPAPEGAGVNKALATLTAAAGVATPLVTPLLTADWRIVAIMVAGALIAGLAVAWFWREHQRDQRQKDAAVIGS